MMMMVVVMSDEMAEKSGKRYFDFYTNGLAIE
jgi:hypothetical protein